MHCNIPLQFFSLLLKEGRLSTVYFFVDLGLFCSIVFTSVLFFQALRGMASENNGHVTCPKTKEIFRVDQADKVYVM